jgi:hypothetical protein
MVDRNAEEALDLGTVEVHCEDAVSAGGLNGVGTDTSANGNAGFVFFVSLGITEVGDDGCDLSSACAFEGIDPEKEFHEVVVDRTMDSLDDETIAAANIFEDPDEDVAFAEHLRLAGGQSDTEAVSNARGEEWISGSGEDREVSHRRRGSGEVVMGTIRRRIHWQGFRARGAGRVPPENEGWYWKVVVYWSCE